MIGFIHHKMEGTSEIVKLTLFPFADEKCHFLYSLGSLYPNKVIRINRIDRSFFPGTTIANFRIIFRFRDRQHEG